MKKVLISIIALLLYFGANAQFTPCPTPLVPSDIKWNHRKGVSLGDSSCIAYVSAGKVLYVDANGTITVITDAALATRLVSTGTWVRIEDTSAMLLKYARFMEVDSMIEASLPPITSYWGTSGNIFSNGQFLGTTNNRGYGERANNIEYRYLDTLGKSYFNKTLTSYLGTERLEVSNGGNNQSPYSLAIGSNCLKSQTGSDKSNTMIGFRAGQSITTGDGNLGIGFQALRLTTSGINNTGVGKSALQALTTGKSNTVFGGNSGLIINGNGNSIIGAFTGDYMSDSLNVVIGGGGNTFGLGAGGYGNGSYNVYVGAKSASTVFQATPHNLRKNTFVGYNTGSSCRGGDSNNIAIGYNVTLTNGSRDKMQIGGLIKGSTLSTGNMAIGGEEVPSAKLALISTTTGFLPPVMTAAQGSLIVPTEGLMIYVTDSDVTFTSKGWWGYNGATWEKLNN